MKEPLLFYFYFQSILLIELYFLSLLSLIFFFIKSIIELIKSLKKLFDRKEEFKEKLGFYLALIFISIMILFFVAMGSIFLSDLLNFSFSSQLSSINPFITDKRILAYLTPISIFITLLNLLFIFFSLVLFINTISGSVFPKKIVNELINDSRNFKNKNKRNDTHILKGTVSNFKKEANK